MQTVETVLGPVPASELKNILPHEHVALYYDHIDEAARNLVQGHFEPIFRELVAAGYNTLVEVTPRRATNGWCKLPAPPGNQRSDMEALRRLSAATGMHIVVSTGYYVEASRPAEFAGMTVDALAKSMVGDIEKGIEDSGVKAGVIKVAISGPSSASDRKLLQAAALAYRETGTAITTHACDPVARRFVLDTLQEGGVPAGRIVMGHADAGASLDETLAVAKSGCLLLYTVWGITGPIGDPMDPPPKDSGFHLPRYFSGYLARALADEGHLGQLLVSTDYYIDIIKNAVHPCMPEMPERDTRYITRFTRPSLARLGFTDAELDTVMHDNPLKTLLPA